MNGEQSEEGNLPMKPIFQLYNYLAYMEVYRKIIQCKYKNEHRNNEEEHRANKTSTHVQIEETSRDADTEMQTQEEPINYKRDRKTPQMRTSPTSRRSQLQKI